MNYNRPCGCKKPVPAEYNGAAGNNAGCGCNTAASAPSSSCGCNTTAASMPASSCGCNAAASAPSSCGCNAAASAPSSCGCNAAAGPVFPGVPCETKAACVDEMALGMSYVPMQKWKNVCNACEGLKCGSIFKDLILPFYCTNCNSGRRCR